MNEYTINIPLSDYEHLKLCELKCNNSYVEKLVILANNLAQTDLRHAEYHDIVTKQNELISFMQAKYYQILEPRTTSEKSDE